MRHQHMFMAQLLSIGVLMPACWRARHFAVHKALVPSAYVYGSAAEHWRLDACLLESWTLCCAQSIGPICTTLGQHVLHTRKLHGLPRSYLPGTAAVHLTQDNGCSVPNRPCKSRGMLTHSAQGIARWTHQRSRMVLCSLSAAPSTTLAWKSSQDLCPNAVVQVRLPSRPLAGTCPSETSDHQ